MCIRDRLYTQGQSSVINVALSGQRFSTRVKKPLYSHTRWYIMTEHQCEDCGLEDVELFGGLCEDCDTEMFATFWTGD